jgi:hypothetical protein
MYIWLQCVLGIWLWWSLIICYSVPEWASPARHYAATYALCLPVFWFWNSSLLLIWAIKFFIALSFVFVIIHYLKEQVAHQRLQLPVAGRQEPALLKWLVTLYQQAKTSERIRHISCWGMSAICSVGFDQPTMECMRDAPRHARTCAQQSSPACPLTRSSVTLKISHWRLPEYSHLPLPVQVGVTGKQKTTCLLRNEKYGKYTGYWEAIPWSLHE